MSFVYHKTFTKPLPAGAAIVVRKGIRLAHWTDRRGKNQTAPLTGDGTRITCEARTYTARYRDETGAVVDAPTGCKDRQAALAVLADLERTAERVKAKIIS